MEGDKGSYRRRRRREKTIKRNEKKKNGRRRQFVSSAEVELCEKLWRESWREVIKGQSCCRYVTGGAETVQEIDGGG